MFTDIVFPDNNEGGFIEIGSRLGYDSLCFIYRFKDLPRAKRIESLQRKAKIRLDTGILADSGNISRAKKLAKVVIVKSSNKNALIFEKNKDIVVYGLEESAPHDCLHQRASGLNHVLCKLAHKNNIRIAFSFSMLLNSCKRHEVLGRVRQNMELCKKYNVDVITASFAEKPYEMRAFRDLRSLFGV
jgi:RNase P/RNase MRP subunit p30